MTTTYIERLSMSELIDIENAITYDKTAICDAITYYANGYNSGLRFDFQEFYGYLSKSMDMFNDINKLNDETYFRNEHSSSAIGKAMSLAVNHRLTLLAFWLTCPYNMHPPTTTTGEQ